MADQEERPNPMPRPEVVNFFAEKGLGSEVDRSIENAVRALRAIDGASTFLASGPAIRVLTSLPYDPDDEVWILSRNEHSGFWTQDRRGDYIAFLAKQVSEHGQLNQTRFVTYSSELASQVMLDDDIYFDLQRLHAPDSLHLVSSSEVSRHGLLGALKWGATVSLRHSYAVIPLPPPEDLSALDLPAGRAIASLLDAYPSYNPAAGPLAAIVTADKTFVDSLVEDLRSLRDSVTVTATR